MKKKKWLVFVVCCFMATSIWAVEKIAFYSANAKSVITQINQQGVESSSIGAVLGLTRDETLNLLRSRMDFNGINHYRYQQAYKGIPVWGMHIIVSKGPSGKVARLHGTMVPGIPNDIESIPDVSSLDPMAALERMKKEHKKRDSKAKWNFKNEAYGTYIYVHKKKAYLSYVVSFFADNEKGNPSRYVHFINAKTGKVLYSFDNLQHADGTGPGGNEKVGYYYYGIDYPPFEVTEIDGTCFLNSPHVRTVDLNHGTTGTLPYSFPCYENTHKPINGAYCPMNDAQYFGKVVFDLYNDNYGVPPVPFQLVIKCHYGTNSETAFWNGSSVILGDGYTTFYPLVALDVVSHEFSHGFTQNNSDLTYMFQSGGINEAFSDIAGEAAEYYMRGYNDFEVGYDIFKPPTGAIRYLHDPPLDGYSIDHIDDYYDGLDVRYSSGIFNKAFYLIATTPGWTTQMAFDIFVKANQDYWQPGTNFQQGAEGARDAALDYGYSCEDVRDAFAMVGITIPCPGAVTNPGFETGDTSGWTETGDVDIASDSHTGSYAVRLNGADSSVEQVVTGLSAGTAYTVSCWGKAKSNAGVYLGVKDYGGAEQTVQFTDFKNFVKKSVTFTTGPTNTSVTIFFIKLNRRFTGIGDDFEIVQN